MSFHLNTDVHRVCHIEFTPIVHIHVPTKFNVVTRYNPIFRDGMLKTDCSTPYIEYRVSGNFSESKIKHLKPLASKYL